MESSGGYLTPLLELAHVALAGQDLLQACLSIDPSTGELEPEGFGTAVKLRRDGNDKLPANENGGVEGALVRGARFEKLINERVARNDDERKLLAWLHQDPVCSKSLEAWFRAGELVQKQVEVNGEEEMACEVHRGEGEASSCFNDVFGLLDYMLDWVNSLMMLALTLAFVSHSEELRLVKEAGGEDASLDARTLQNLNTPSPIDLPKVPCAPCGARNFCGCGMIGWMVTPWRSHTCTSGRTHSGGSRSTRGSSSTGSTHIA